MKLTFFAKNISRNISRCIHLFILFLTVFVVYPSSSPANAAENYQLSYSLDRTELKNSETFKINISVVNSGDKDISNFEVRVPFYSFVGDTEVLTVNPSFNKLLSSSEYPIGFNSRSWLVNTLAIGETRNFSVEYKVIDDPKISNGLSSVFTFPGTWSDPKGLETNKALKLNIFRSDIYINSVYKTSHEYGLPKLTLLDNEVSTVKLPEKYTYGGSKTTSLKTINSSNIKAFSNFILETQDVLMEWQMPVDFSGSDVAPKLQKLDEYLKVGWGSIDAPEKDLAFLLNKPVKVTFKNTNFVNEPRIKLKGTDVDIKTAKASWVKGNDKITLTLDSLADVSLYPNLTLDKTVVETAESFITIKGKTSDPNSEVSYKIDESTDVKEIFGIDLQTGDFEVRIDGIANAKQVEFSSKLRNGEINEKIVLVKSTASSITPTVAITSTPRTNSQLVNPITTALLLAALATLSVLAGFIYYLNYRRKVAKSHEIFIKNTNIKSDDQNPLEEVYSLKDLSSGKQELKPRVDAENNNKVSLLEEGDVQKEGKKEDETTEPPKFLKSE